MKEKKFRQTKALKTIMFLSVLNYSLALWKFVFQITVTQSGTNGMRKMCLNSYSFFLKPFIGFYGCTNASFSTSSFVQKKLCSSLHLAD